MNLLREKLKNNSEHKPARDICDYFHKYFYPISALIESLYQIKGCNCGGLCHIVVDEDNLYDDCLDSVLELCELEENKGREDTEICLAICKLMKRMTFYQRATLFFMMTKIEINKPGDCNEDSVFRLIYEPQIPNCYKMFDWRHEFHSEDEVHPEKE